MHRRTMIQTKYNLPVSRLLLSVSHVIDPSDVKTVGIVPTKSANNGTA